MIPDGFYHLVCEIIVKHTDGTYLLMQRDLNKHYGGMWEATAGGSAVAGENPLECAMGIPVVVWGCFFCALKVRKVGEWRQNGVIRGKMWFYYWENGIILEYRF